MSFYDELEIARICNELRREFYHAVKRNFAPCIVLSGGVDTSVITAVASLFSSLTGVTVASNAAAPDLPYAKEVAERFNMEHLVLTPAEEDLVNALERVIPVIRSFDPMEVHGSVVVYLALEKAKELGFNSVMTGDGGDELFAGYTFYFNLSYDELKCVLERTWQVMSFSSTYIGNYMQIKVLLPYLDESFKKFAMRIDTSLKIRRENGKTWGKWILRKAFENIVPHKVIWRDKIHVGAGSSIETTLPRIAEKIPESEFRQKTKEYERRDSVTIKSKEHLLYYEIFRKHVGIPSELGDSDRRCPSCNAPLRDTLTKFCRVCGAYPI